MKRIMFSLATILSLFGIIGASPAQAAYPERPITMIVPFGAGGATDVVARFIAAHMEKRLGKTIVVKNVVGTGGILGMAAAAEAKPDGYTIAFAPIAPLIMHPAFRDTPYTLQDMCSIARATNDPLYLEVSKNSPIRNMADMAAAIKADPDNQFYGHVGVGSQIHLSLAHIFSSMGLKLRSVTMKDDPEAMQAMAAGRIQYYTSLPSLLARYDIRAIAVLSEERNPATPDIPTAKEQGVDIVYTQWMSLVGPKGIPDDIINILATTFEDVCKDPEYIKDLATLNTAPAFLGPEENQKFMEEEQAVYTRIINEMLKPTL